MKSLLVTLLFSVTVLIDFPCQGSTIHLKGQSPSFRQKYLSVYAVEDYLTQTRTLLAKSFINSQGEFEISFPAYYPHTGEYIIEINNATVSCYLRPDHSYYCMIVPDEESIRNRIDPKLIVDFPYLPPNDPNLVIARYNAEYSHFLFTHMAYIKKQDRRQLYLKYLAFKKEIQKNFESNADAFTAHYLYFSLLDLEATFEFFPRRNESEKSLPEEEICYLRYLKNKPVLLHHPEYMNYLNNLWKGKIPTLRLSKGLILMGAINNAMDFALILKHLQQYATFKNDTLREILLLKGLKEMYFNKNTDSARVRKFIQWIASDTPREIIKKHAFNILKWIQSQKHISQPHAWNLSLKDLQGNIQSLTQWKGTPLYLHFWSFNSLSSMKDMLVIKELQKKYQGRIFFISIHVGEDEKKWKNFVKEYSWDWTQLFARDLTEITPYTVFRFPTYCLIGKNFELIAFPAPGPLAEGGKSIETLFQFLLSNK